MKTLLEKAKRVLISQANVLHDICREDLDLDAIISCPKKLGEIVFQIDSYESLGDLIKDLENDNLQELGYWGADVQELIEDFLTQILKNK